MYTQETKNQIHPRPQINKGIKKPSTGANNARQPHKKSLRRGVCHAVYKLKEKRVCGKLVFQHTLCLQFKDFRAKKMAAGVRIRRDTEPE